MPAGNRRVMRFFSGIMRRDEENDPNPKRKIGYGGSSGRSQSCRPNTCQCDFGNAEPSKKSEWFSRRSVVITPVPPTRGKFALKKDNEYLNTKQPNAAGL